MKHVIQGLLALILLCIALSWLTEAIVQNMLAIIAITVVVTALVVLRVVFKSYFNISGRMRH